MTIDRALNYTTATDGADWAADVDSTVNWLAGSFLGRLTSVAGTNAITAQLAVDTGFSALSDHAYCVLVPANTTTAAVTLAIEGGSAIAVRDGTGAVLASTKVLSAGTTYLLQYNSAEGYWRVISPELQSTEAGAIIETNYIATECFPASGTFTAPHKCNARIIAIGAGGGGGHQDGSATPRGTGGGAGGFVSLEVALADAAALTITIGAAGVGADGLAGTAGGNTTVVGTGINISANGGSGGGIATSGTASGGAGGAASGGDKNFSGGDGGDASADYTATGGGAVGIITNGLDAVANSTANSATNGAGFHTTDTIAGYQGCTYPPLDVLGVKGGPGQYDTGSVGDSGETDGGNLCGGGGAASTTSGGSSTVLGGKGGIAVISSFGNSGSVIGGGGGGAASNDGGTSSKGGDGGEGLVIVQSTGDTG